METLVDHSRSTPAHGTVPGHAGRTLVTTVLYPATGPRRHQPVPGATPDRTDGPYPLIVFAHGFGSNVTSYLPLLEKWAGAGFVVAAPLFPLTNADAPGGPDLSDYVHQPGDMSFVVTQMLHQSSSSSGPLSGLIDPSEVGAAGHSLGGVTTLGLVANTCCRDGRIKAAVVMSGDPITFPTGQGRGGGGSAHPAGPRQRRPGRAVRVQCRRLQPVLGLPRVCSPSSEVTTAHRSIRAGRAFGSVVRATTDFFDRYLKGQQAALGRLRDDAQPGITTLTFVSQAGRHVVLPVPKTTVGRLQATVTPSAGLAPGQSVTVAWNGYIPNQSVNVLECSKSPPTQATDCDLTTGVLLHPDPTGTGSVSFTVTTGTVGSGVCDATHPGCVVVINQGGSLDPAASVIVPISFG